MAWLRISDISVSVAGARGERKPVLDSISLTVEAGEFVTLFGPNGCGKTTLLNTIMGHVTPERGEVNIASKKRTIGYVYQDYRSSLLPWLTAKENICFPLRIKRIARRAQDTKFGELISAVPTGVDWSAYPYQLSGGQAQMVSILRGLIISPNALLLDEPFSALDYQTNLHMLKWFEQIWQKTKISVVFVSHQIDEAIFLGDRVVLLSARPAGIVTDIRNTLPRPRSLEVMGSEEFREIKSRILSQFVDMVEREKQ
jgi:NitT/TauT family transport system ATP-binding protein